MQERQSTAGQPLCWGDYSGLRQNCKFLQQIWLNSEQSKEPTRYPPSGKRRVAVRLTVRAICLLPSSDDHVIGLTIVNALIETAVGDEWLEAGAFERFERFFET